METNKERRDRAAREYEARQAPLALCNAVAGREAERERKTSNSFKANVMNAVSSALSKHRTIPEDVVPKKG